MNREFFIFNRNSEFMLALKNKNINILRVFLDNLLSLSTLSSLTMLYEAVIIIIDFEEEMNEDD